ncbi:MAG: patatin-like phospholipase family protein [Paracoccaceae bacterium]
MARRKTRTVDLALQGGGAHGAFTWGVLDRLLEEEALEFEGISATSAGAMNAAALKTGLLDGGSREAARKALDGFWGEIARLGASPSNPLLAWVRAFAPTTSNLADAIEASPGWQFGDTLTRMFSPYDLNPFNLNPLRELLNEKLDFDAVCRDCRPHLFVGATNVRNGRVKIFQGRDVSVDAILASTALPTLFQAVEIEGEAYWDGGYTGNPALFPLFYETETRDVVIVHVNPIVRQEVPRSSREILNRMNEVSFNAALLGELRAVAFVRRLIAEGRIAPGTMKDVLVHSIQDDETMNKLGVATKVHVDAALIANLKEAGRVAADAFLRANWRDIGTRSSIDIEGLL